MYLVVKKSSEFMKQLLTELCVCLTDTAAMNCRYDHQIAIWGKNFQDRLGQMKMFLVGAGALGCEFLKSFALMGCGTKEQGCDFSDGALTAMMGSL